LDLVGRSLASNQVVVRKSFSFFKILWFSYLMIRFLLINRFPFFLFLSKKKKCYLLNSKIKEDI
jgi:hypothetical protein